MENQLFGKDIAAAHARNGNQPLKHIIGTGNDPDSLFFILSLQCRCRVNLPVSQKWKGCLRPTTVGEINGAISWSK